MVVENWLVINDIFFSIVHNIIQCNQRDSTTKRTYIPFCDEKDQIFDKLKLLL
jgi:hypothetical protein